MRMSYELISRKALKREFDTSRKVGQTTFSLSEIYRIIDNAPTIAVYIKGEELP